MPVVPDFGYHRIPGLILTTNSRKVPRVTSVGQCQDECNRQPLCKSYSFEPKKNGCIWSSDNLTYDPDFVLALKPTEGDGDYEELPGMTFHATGWMRSEGKDKSACKQLCQQGAHCRAFAWRKRDNLCMLTGESIGISDSWDYYEKDGVAKRSAGFPIKPKNAGAPAIPAQPSENPKIIKQEVKKEKQELAQSQHEVAQAKQQVADVKKQSALQAKALGDKTREEEQLKQRLQEVKAWAKNEMTHQAEEGKIKLKAAEVKGKANAVQQQSSDDAKLVEKKRAQNAEQAKLKGDAEIAAAKQKSNQKLELDSVKEEKALAQSEMKKAAEQKAAAEAKISADKAEIDRVKELGNKKDADYQAALKAEKDKTNEKEEKLNTKEKQAMSKAEVEEQDAVAEARRKVIAEMESQAQTELTNVAESSSKAEAKEANEKDVERQKATQRAAEVKSLKDEVAAQRSTALDLQKQIAKAKTDEAVGVQQAELEKTKLASEAKNKIAMTKLNAQKAEIDAQTKIEETRRASQERVRKTERSQAVQLASAKEGSEKYKANNAPSPLVAAAAKDGIDKLKEVAQKASKMDPAQGQAMLEKAKAEYRANMRDVEEGSVNRPTTYHRVIEPAESAHIESPSLELLEIGEGSEPSAKVKELASTLWPLDRPTAGDSDPAPGTSAAELAEAADLAAKVRGYMSAQNGNKVKVSYVKFPITPLEDGEALNGASLTLNKISGPESAATVSVTSCEYDKSALTFATRPATVAALTSGAQYPAADGPTSIPLNPTLVAQYLNQKQICLEIGGGGADTPVLYEAPQIKLEVGRPAATVEADQIPLKTGITMERRRRSAVKIDAGPRNVIGKLQANAQKVKDEALAELQPKLKHEMDTLMPTALEKEKEEITNAMSKAHKKVLAMKIELIKADPVLKDQITNEVKVEYAKRLIKEVNDRLPERLNANKEVATAKRQAQLKSQIAAKLNALSEARLAKQLPKQISKSLLLLKHTKLDSASQSSISATKMEEAIKPELDKYEENLDLSKAAENNAMAKLKKEVNSKLPGELAAQLPGAVEQAAKKQVEPKIMAQLAAKKTEMIQNKYDFLYNSVIADGGDEAERLKADDTKQAAEDELKQKAENMLPGNWKETAKTEIRAELMAKAEEELEPKVKTDLQASLKKSMLKDLEKTKKKGLMESYITVQKGKLMKSQRKALEDNYKHAEMEKAVNKAEDDGAAQVTDAEVQQLKRAVTKKLTDMEKKKVNHEIQAEYNKELQGAAYTEQLANDFAQLETSTRNELRAELKPAMVKSEQAAIADKVESAKRIKIEELTADMDKKLEANIAAATTLAKLTEIVKPRMEAKLQAKLKMKLEGEVSSTLSDDGLAKKMADTIREKYMEGTKKAAEAFVNTHNRQDIENKLKNEARARAKQIANSKAVPEVKKAMDLLAKRLQSELSTEAAPSLEEKISEASEGMSASDTEKIRLQLTAESNKKVKEDAQARADKKRAEIKAKIHSDLLRKEEEKAIQAIGPHLKTAIEQKVDQVAETAIQKKIKKELDKLEGVTQAEEPEVPIDPFAPSQADEEADMVAAVATPKHKINKAAKAAQDHTQQEKRVNQARVDKDKAKDIKTPEEKEEEEEKAAHKQSDAGKKEEADKEAKQEEDAQNVEQDAEESADEEDADEEDEKAEAEENAADKEAEEAVEQVEAGNNDAAEGNMVDNEAAQAEQEAENPAI